MLVFEGRFLFPQAFPQCCQEKMASSNIMRTGDEFDVGLNV